MINDKSITNIHSKKTVIVAAILSALLAGSVGFAVGSFFQKSSPTAENALSADRMSALDKNSKKEMNNLKEDVNKKDILIEQKNDEESHQKFYDTKDSLPLIEPETKDQKKKEADDNASGKFCKEENFCRKDDTEKLKKELKVLINSNDTFQNVLDKIKASKKKIKQQSKMVIEIFNQKLKIQNQAMLGLKLLLALAEESNKKLKNEKSNTQQEYASFYEEVRMGLGLNAKTCKAEIVDRIQVLVHKEQVFGYVEQQFKSINKVRKKLKADFVALKTSLANSDKLNEYLENRIEYSEDYLEKLKKSHKNFLNSLRKTLRMENAWYFSKSELLKAIKELRIYKDSNSDLLHTISVLEQQIEDLKAIICETPGVFASN